MNRVGKLLFLGRLFLFPLVRIDLLLVADRLRLQTLQLQLGRGQLLFPGADVIGKKRIARFHRLALLHHQLLDRSAGIQLDFHGFLRFHNARVPVLRAGDVFPRQRPHGGHVRHVLTALAFALQEMPGPGAQKARRRHNSPDNDDPFFHNLFSSEIKGSTIFGFYHNRFQQQGQACTPMRHKQFTVFIVRRL